MSLILVVDDEECLRDIIREMLEVGGYDDVSFAVSGKEAIQFCHERAIDLVITDLMMPDMDGFELICSLRESNPNLRILATSGSSNDLLKTATALGAVGTLSKPFTMAELVTAVDKSLGKHANQ